MDGVGVGVGVGFDLVEWAMSQLSRLTSSSLERDCLLGLGWWDDKELVVGVVELLVEFGWSSSSSLLSSGDGEVTPRASSCSARGVSIWTV